MLKTWNCFVLFCAVCNAVTVGVAWYSGEPAWWFVWVSAIWFSVDVALLCGRELMEAS